VYISYQKQTRINQPNQFWHILQTGIALKAEVRHCKLPVALLLASNNDKSQELPALDFLGASD
jgi:hypothetical protein